MLIFIHNVQCTSIIFFTVTQQITSLDVIDIGDTLLSAETSSYRTPVVANAPHTDPYSPHTSERDIPTLQPERGLFSSGLPLHITGHSASEMLLVQPPVNIL